MFQIHHSFTGCKYFVFLEKGMSNIELGDYIYKPPQSEHTRIDYSNPTP